MTTQSLAHLITQVEGGDISSLARLLTQLERWGPMVLNEDPRLLLPPQKSLKIGITGPPGAGKSTLVSELIGELRQLNFKVAVMAIDPSSPITNGAILGDRIRYSQHFNDPNVFIRSLGTRGSLGGLSGSAYLMLRAFDLADFDITLIETVGVGQTELDVVNIADYTIVLLVPESGDSIQAMKSGLLEVAHLYVVNKCDRPGAENLLQHLKAYAGSEKHKPDIISTVATQSIGISPLIKKIEEQLRHHNKHSNRSKEKIQKEAQALLRLQFEKKIALLTKNIQTEQDLLKILNGDNVCKP